MLTLTDVKTYIRATDEDDDMVRALMSAAVSYLEGAVSDYAERYETGGQAFQAKADLAQEMLIADWYENRTPVDRPVSPAVRLLIAQLQAVGGETT